MSLAAYAIRTCLWRALYEHTSAGKLVFDSSINPLEELLKGTPAPVIVISTEDENSGAEGITGFSFTSADRELTLIIEIAIGTAMKDRAGYLIEQTDDGLEQNINYLVRQVQRVMQVDMGDWSDLFRSFVCNVKRFQSRRGTGGEGVKFAARQIQIVCEPLAEPDFGVTPYGEWLRLVNAMKADAEMFADEAPGFEAEIIGEVIPSWAQLQARLGFRRGAMAGVGVGPLSLIYPDKITLKLDTVGDHLGSTNA